VQISTLCFKERKQYNPKRRFRGQGDKPYFDRNNFTSNRKGRNIVRLDKLAETRSDVNEMLGMDQYIDLIIPRGSNEFVRYIMDNSKIPVMGHADGICHCFIDRKPI
jgi:glutamate-5-semialdehyde dehydrogenase